MAFQAVARFGFAGGGNCELTNAQWAALRYFRNVNRFSRTLSGFANFHSTTRGSASQTIGSLVKKRLLDRRLNDTDRRRVLFELTEKLRKFVSVIRLTNSFA